MFFDAAHLDPVAAVGEDVADGLVGRHQAALLVDDDAVERRGEGDDAAVGFDLAGQQFEQGRLARAVGPDDRQHAAGRDVDAAHALGRRAEEDEFSQSAGERIQPARIGGRVREEQSARGVELREDAAPALVLEHATRIGHPGTGRNEVEIAAVDVDGHVLRGGAVKEHVGETLAVRDAEQRVESGILEVEVGEHGTAASATECAGDPDRRARTQLVLARIGRRGQEHAVGSSGQLAADGFQLRGRSTSIRIVRHACGRAIHHSVRLRSSSSRVPPPSIER